MSNDVVNYYENYKEEDRIKTKAYLMKTDVLDATDMSMFKDESFDVVLNMDHFII